MLSLESLEIKKSQCIKIDTFENLSVIPYIRGRLVFAELAARVIEDGEFDLVVVDLPYFMNGKVWLGVPVRLFPYVSSLVIRKEDSTFVNFPFWANGMLDDYPAVVSHFYERLQLGALGFFDKLKALDDIIKNTFRNSTKKEFADLSIRQLIIFEQYLLKRLAMNRTLTPPFLPNLFDMAHSCLGKGFANEMARKLLQYPYPEMDEVLNYFNIQYEDVILGQRFSVPDLSSIPFFHTGTNKFSFDNFHNGYTSINELIEFANKVCHRITKKELKELGGVGETEWAITDDYRLHEIACTKVRDIVERKRHRVIIRRSFGSMGDGIHWKATIASMAKGEDAIYIKIIRKAIRGKLSRLDEFTPVAFFIC